MSELHPDLTRYFEVALAATRCAVLTGAGVSAESGVPTFRGEEGLWREYRAEELATPEAFARNPELVREWYDYRRGLLADIEPNEGHRALADAERAFEMFTLVTQNVDGLHARAGSSDVVELHGNIRHDRCDGCGTVRVADGATTCTCGGPMRPAVVWFGEALPPEAIERAFFAAQNADIFFTVGTSTQVYPAAQLPYLASDAGAYVVEVNPEPTPFTPIADVSIRGPSGEWLPELLDPLLKAREEGR
jgi:NAD-dependent deacetylase